MQVARQFTHGAHLAVPAVQLADDTPVVWAEGAERLLHARSLLRLQHEAVGRVVVGQGLVLVQRGTLPHHSRLHALGLVHRVAVPIQEVHDILPHPPRGIGLEGGASVGTVATKRQQQADTTLLAQVIEVKVWKGAVTPHDTLHYWLVEQDKRGFVHFN